MRVGKPSLFKSEAMSTSSVAHGGSTTSLVSGPMGNSTTAQASRGPGTTGFALGDPVIVYGPWGCGLCMNCRQGMENYCQ